MPGTAAQNAAVPAPPTVRGPEYWSGAAFMGAAEVGAMQNYFNVVNGQLAWDFPLALGGVNADQAVQLQSDLTRASLRAGAIQIGAVVNTTISSGLGASLDAGGDGQYHHLLRPRCQPRCLHHR